MWLDLGRKSTEIPLYNIPEETRQFGKKTVHFHECPSTNTEAVRFTEINGIHHGAVFICDHQSAGRGQAGNRWESEPKKNLTFSIVLENPVEPENHFYLNIFLSLALSRCLSQHTGREVQVKWPNDLMAGGKKLGGILIENTIQGKIIRYSVAGIGLNVNQTLFNIPSATSLALLTGTNFEKDVLLESLLMAMEVEFNRLKKNDFPGLLADWLKHLYLLNRPHQFFKDGKAFEGIITGIDQQGRLEMRINTATYYFNFKEIIFS
jgi:BirA family biotin operon repressor/biotin-[acetyl-CoA-carboxylase] ligase